LAYPYAGRVRLWLRYRPHWPAAMLTCGLSTHLDRGRHVPRIIRIRSNRWCDLLTVRMCDGQTPTDWASAAERLAHSLRVPAVSVRTGRRLGRVVVTLRRRDPLAQLVPPLPIGPVVDFARLPLGCAETGEIYLLRLPGEHVLIGGATGAGKGSVISALLAVLAPAIAARLVQVWAFDPKGGMELAFAAPLFHRFAFGSPEAMCEVLEQAVKEMAARTDRLRGHTRQHVPSVAEPLIVLLVDELAALTAYVGDRKTKDRLRDAFSLLLSQGRAVGVHVVAAIQDPRKEVLPFRDLFTTRIALRLTEPEQVKLILSDTARDLGAACDRIDHSTPGVGYVLLDGTPEPVRVRFTYHDDAAVRALAARYGRPHADADLTGGAP
jgi:S-DNA-T family DNA segregation ATPase FtsK/SpoIIIE